MARKKGPQAQEAYTYIKKKIQYFELAPGAAVSDHALSEELNMSRSPIREAMMRLEAEGLVEFKDRGASVTFITLKDIIEICQVRRAVEEASIQILMDNGGATEEQKAALTACYDHMKISSAPVENYFYDDQFHDLIMNMCGNQRLVDISNQMRAQIYRARWLNCLLPNRMKEADVEHAAIYRSIMAGKRKESVESVIYHLNQSEKNFREILSSANYNEQMLSSIPKIVGIQSI